MFRAIICKVKDCAMNDSPNEGFRQQPIWLLGVAGLVIAQAGLALALFGSGQAWSAVTDDRPVLSGRHPLHLYHGTLGAEAFRDHGTTTCYDPQFQAGYPKTPVFDGGSRPAELFLWLGGGTYRPSAYKLGLFVFLLLIPLALVLAARGADLPAAAAVLAGAGGIVLGWSEPVRRMIAEGQLDLLAAGLAALVFVPWLARFTRTLGLDAWGILAGTALVGWYFHPLIWLGLAPVVLVFYLVFAPRHGPAWHLGLLGITFAGIAPNVWWLLDWGRYWWLRQPAAWNHIPIPDWSAILGNVSDYPPLFGCLPGGPVLLLGGLVGSAFLWRTGQRTAAWLLLLAAFLDVVVARVAWAWPALSPAIPQKIVVLAAGFIVPPTAFGLWLLLKQIRIAAIGTAFTVLGLLIVGLADGPSRPLAKACRVAGEPLVIGFSTEQRELIALLKTHTTTEARILWDETTDQCAGWNWSALLPLLTDRSYLGGLDPEAGVEHSYCAMCNRQLTGRALGEWNDADLKAFCDWYNVGWVVARSPATVERWGKFSLAKPLASLTEGGQTVVVYALDRPKKYVLEGTATWETADTHRVVLTNVVPNADGEVQLSLHMLEGLRVSPSYVRVEGMRDRRDPTDHVRLLLPGPVPRVTLTWEAP
jgi:hypothetical protein